MMRKNILHCLPLVKKYKRVKTSLLPVLMRYIEKISFTMTNRGAKTILTAHFHHRASGLFSI